MRDEALAQLKASYERYMRKSAEIMVRAVDSFLEDGDKSKVKGMTGTIILDEWHDYQQAVEEERMKKLKETIESGSLELPSYRRNIGDEIIEGLNHAVKYAKADVVLIKLEKEAEEILNSIDPPFYFAYSRWHELEKGLSIRARIGEGGWKYELGPDTKWVTRSEAVNLIMLFQEMDEEDV